MQLTLALTGIAVAFFVIGFCAGAVFFRWLFDDAPPRFDPNDDPPLRGWGADEITRIS